MHKKDSKSVLDSEEKKTNEWVLEGTGVERDLLNLIKSRKLSYFGHVMKKEGDCLEKEIMQAHCTGSKKAGETKDVIDWQHGKMGSNAISQTTEGDREQKGME